jgi:hypothetical protein
MPANYESVSHFCEEITEGEDLNSNSATEACCLPSLGRLVRGIYSTVKNKCANDAFLSGVFRKCDKVDY